MSQAHLAGIVLAVVGLIGLAIAYLITRKDKLL